MTDERNIDLSESDAWNRVDLNSVKTGSFENTLRNVRILKIVKTTKKERKYFSLNSDVSLWLSQVGFSTRKGYTINLCYFLKCISLNPSELLDLKLSEDPRRRYFPAEQLILTWINLARKKGLTPCKIHDVLMALRSFFRYSRIPLLRIKHVYRPKPKASLDQEQLLKFREGFNFYDKILYDFLSSAPLRDGQFQKCKNCDLEFFPRWRDIITYPQIYPYSPFVIKPQKGHESDQYSEGLRQVCFLTKTAATGLNSLRTIKETKLKRPLNPDEYIFTHHINLYGPAHIAPITKGSIITYFQTAAERTGVHLYPHYLRSWVNSILASRGIDKQLRDLYLGHSCAYEMGYIIQLLPQWQKTFREAKALEYLDFVTGIPNETQQDQHQKKGSLNNQDVKFLQGLLDKLKKDSVGGTQG